MLQSFKTIFEQFICKSFVLQEGSQAPVGLDMRRLPDRLPPPHSYATTNNQVQYMSLSKSAQKERDNENFPNAPLEVVYETIPYCVQLHKNPDQKDSDCNDQATKPQLDESLYVIPFLTEGNGS